MPEPFEEIELKNLDDFDNFYSEILKNRSLFECVFRGQSEAIWGLVPSILRKFNSETVQNDALIDTIKQEFTNVSDFVKTADKSGFDFPGTLWELINPEGYNLSDIGNFAYWYLHEKHEWKEITTIAQHFGTPTRYLDFTFSPYTALFFAAKEVFCKLVKQIKEAKHSNHKFSIWFINRTYLRHPNCKVRHFEVPTARNRYLYAQRGLFLSPNLPRVSEVDVGTKKSFPTMDFDLCHIVVENSHEIAKGDKDIKTIWPIMYKFNFPFSVAPQILVDLDNKHGINIATIKPNLDNIIPYINFSKRVKKHIDKTSKQN